MKPIHFRPNPDASAQNEAAQRAYEANQGPGVAAIVRSATSTEQSATTRHQRQVQLDDYVARIRQTARDTQPTDSSNTKPPEVIFKTLIQDKNEASDDDSIIETVHTPAFVDTPEPDIQAGEADVDASSISKLYPNSSANDAESSPPNPEVAKQFNDALHQLRAPHVPTEDFSPAGQRREEHRRLDAAYQRQLIDNISVAIASALTDVPDEQIQAKLSSAETETVTPAPEPTSDSEIESPTDLPIDIAAWDVEDFRWPTLSNQMIATASNAMQELFDQVLNVCNSDEARPSNRLAVTGTGRGEGTSTIAISIARWAAACGKSVLLVDADLASPSLTTQIGLEHGLSWLKAVERNDDPAEVIIRSQRTELCVMPLAPIVARSEYPRCLFDSLGPFLGKVESHFDWVVIDFGPGSQLLAELSRPELLVDSALLIGADSGVNGLDSLQRRLQSMGLERFVLAQNSVRYQEAA